MIALGIAALRFLRWDFAVGKVALFEAIALYCGASSGVAYFNCVARSLWWLGARLFRLAWRQLFDDIAHVEYEDTTPSARMAAQFLFDVSSWKWAAHQRDPPSCACPSLGVVFRFPESGNELVLVAIRPGRVELLEEAFEVARVCRVFPYVAAAFFAGMVVYLRSQLCGRIGVLLLSKLLCRASGPNCTAVLTEYLEEAIGMLVSLV